MTDTDVLVAGAGPVGLLLAGSLARRGVRVVLVERLGVPHGESRASQLTPRAMEILDRLGIVDRFGALERVPTGHFGGLGVDVSGVRSSYPGFWKCPQSHTEGVLGAWVRESGVDVRRGTELKDLSEARDRVGAELSGPDGATRVDARWLVGCDGEESTVRRLAGIAFPGTDATLEMLRADLDGIDVPDRRFQRLPGGVAVAARRPDGVTRLMVHEYGRPAGSRHRTPDGAEVAAAWERVTGEDVGAGTLLWSDTFDDACRQAETYARGRVLLAGDAAHQHMPVGGMALHLGLEDADNLAWKLAAVVHGTAAPALLGTYHEERHRAGATALVRVRAQTMLLLGDDGVDPVRGILTDLLRIPRVADRLASAACGLEPSGTAGPGVPLPSGDVRTADGPVPVADLLRTPRGVLLAPDADAVVGGWRDRVDPVPVRAPCDGPLAGTDGVLVRPDGVVADVAQPGAGAGALRTALRTWFGEETDRAGT